MIERDDMTGVVLAGGLGRRMRSDGQGINKALRPFRGRPMIDHVIERLRPQVGALLITCANADAQAFAARGLPVIPDAIAGHPGPLAGLHAGLQAADTRWVLTAPCDCPFLPPDLAQRLAGAVTAGTDLAVVHTGEQAHPVFMLAACRLLDDLADFLARGGRKIDLWYDTLAVARVDFGDEHPFRNINTPEDLDRFT
ncbi:MAG: molybdenum cofactor guanylyltransferase MobA [Burkholderiaceae bacterium]